MKDMIRVYKALSDESRLRVLNLLFRRECCVCEVEQVLEVSQSKASRMLSVLMNAGLLTHRQDGLWSLYSIDWDGLDENVRDTLKAVQREFSDEQQMKRDLEQLETTDMYEAACCGRSCATEVKA